MLEHRRRDMREWAETRAIAFVLVLIAFAGWVLHEVEGGGLTETTLEDGTKVLVSHWQIREAGKINVPPAIALDLPGGQKMAMAYIPRGDYLMGSHLTAKEMAEKFSEKEHFFVPEVPEHRVTIVKGFYLSLHEVTQAQWQAVMGTLPWRDPSASEWDWPGILRFRVSHPKCPANCVSWYDCQRFLGRLNRVAGPWVRLPTEAEWEYACRGGTGTDFYFGDSCADLPRYEWVRTNTVMAGQEYPHPVGEKIPNAWGLFDMCGNVSEWCADWFGKDYYASSPKVDPAGPRLSADASRSIRGGSWVASDFACRSASRLWLSPWGKCPLIGFRCAADVGAVRTLRDPFWQAIFGEKSEELLADLPIVHETAPAGFSYPFPAKAHTRGEIGMDAGVYRRIVLCGSDGQEQAFQSSDRLDRVLLLLPRNLTLDKAGKIIHANIRASDVSLHFAAVGYPTYKPGDWPPGFLPVATQATSKLHDSVIVLKVRNGGNNLLEFECSGSTFEGLDRLRAVLFVRLHENPRLGVVFDVDPRVNWGSLLSATGLALKMAPSKVGIRIAYAEGRSDHVVGLRTVADE